MTKTLLQNIEVLSAGQDFKKDAEGKPVSVPVINLLATPAQAEMLSLAAAQTNVQLVLRNPLDHDTVKTNGTALGSLFVGKAPAPAVDPNAPRVVRRRAPTAAVIPVVRQVPPRRDPFVMEIISGTKKVETRFDNAAVAAAEANQ